MLLFSPQTQQEFLVHEQDATHYVLSYYSSQKQQLIVRKIAKDRIDRQLQQNKLIHLTPTFSPAFQEAMSQILVRINQEYLNQGQVQQEKRDAYNLYLQLYCAGQLNQEQVLKNALLSLITIPTPAAEEESDPIPAPESTPASPLQNADWDNDPTHLQAEKQVVPTPEAQSVPETAVSEPEAQQPDLPPTPDADSEFTPTTGEIPLADAAATEQPPTPHRSQKKEPTLTKKMWQQALQPLMVGKGENKHYIEFH